MLLADWRRFVYPHVREPVASRRRLQRENILLFAVSPADRGYKGPQLGAFWDQLTAPIRTLPGVPSMHRLLNIAGLQREAESGHDGRIS